MKGILDVKGLVHRSCCTECRSINLWRMDQWFEEVCRDCRCRESKMVRFPYKTVYTWQEERS